MGKPTYFQIMGIQLWITGRQWMWASDTCFLNHFLKL